MTTIQLIQTEDVCRGSLFNQFYKKYTTNLVVYDWWVDLMLSSFIPRKGKTTTWVERFLHEKLHKMIDYNELN